MPRSMTGYGRARELFEQREIIVELRSVNHKFFEFSSKLPRQLAFLEDRLKSLLAKSIARGKVEVYVSVQPQGQSDLSVRVNTPLAAGYISALREANGELGIKDDLSLSMLLRIPDIFTLTKLESDESLLTEQVIKVAQKALEGFIEMRRSEGGRLAADMREKLEHISETAALIEKRSPEVVGEYRQRLYQRLSELLGDRGIDDSRVLTEAAIFADKTAVDEELVRLKSHIEAFGELLDSDSPIGKRLDFLVQEMNREVNTTGSKCSDLEITRNVVELKATIEKLREQLQNIE